MAYNPYGYGPTPDEELKLAQAKKLSAETNKIMDLLPRPSRTGPSSPQEAGIPHQPPLLPKDTAQADKTQAEAEEQRRQTAWAKNEIAGKNFGGSYAKGGPVTGKYTKGTGAVNIGDWVAPMKSRGGK